MELANCLQTPFFVSFCKCKVFANCYCRREKWKTVTLSSKTYNKNETMKRILFLFALLLAVSAQAQESAKAQQVKYTVKGVSKENGKTVYLEDKLTSKVVDSIVVAKGKFVFKGVADKDAIFAITFDKDNWQSWHTLFFNDGKTISVNMNDSTLKGSPLNERLAYYNKEILGLPGSYYPEYKYKMVKKMFEEELETLLPARSSWKAKGLLGQKDCFVCWKRSPPMLSIQRLNNMRRG